jgi:hypothetical protein
VLICHAPEATAVVVAAHVRGFDINEAAGFDVKIAVGVIA